MQSEMSSVLFLARNRFQGVSESGVAFKECLTYIKIISTTTTTIVTNITYYDNDVPGWSGWAGWRGGLDGGGAGWKQGRAEIYPILCAGQRSAHNTLLAPVASATPGHPILNMGGCQHYGPFLNAHYNTAPNN